MRVKLNRATLANCNFNYGPFLGAIYTAKEDGEGFTINLLEHDDNGITLLERFSRSDLIFLDDKPETKPLTGWSTSYYEIPEGAKELQDIIEHKKMNFAVGNIFKAAYRLGEKEGTSAEYDLNKIIWFAQRELERIKK